MMLQYMANQQQWFFKVDQSTYYIHKNHGNLPNPKNSMVLLKYPLF